VLTLPWGFVPTQGYLAVPIVTFISFVLGSLELVAEEIEEPFGLDQNDLPLQKMSDNIDKHVGEIFG
jgi:putative membrane protein